MTKQLKCAITNLDIGHKAEYFPSRNLRYNEGHKSQGARGLIGFTLCSSLFFFSSLFKMENCCIITHVSYVMSVINVLMTEMGVACSYFHLKNDRLSVGM